MSLIDEIKIKSLSDAQEILKAAGSEDIFEKAHKDGDLHPNGKWVWVSSAAGGKGDWRTLNGRTHKKHQSESGGNSTGVSSASSSSRKVNSSQNNVNVRTDLPKIEYGGNAKKDAAAIARAGDILKKEGFTLGDDNLYHHKDGRVVRINTKTGYFEETARNANNDRTVKSSVKNEDKSSKSKKSSVVKVDMDTIDQDEYNRAYKEAKSANKLGRTMGLSVITSNINKYKKKLEETISNRPGAKATIKKLQGNLTKFISQKKATEDVNNEVDNSKTTSSNTKASSKKEVRVGYGNFHYPIKIKNMTDNSETYSHDINGVSVNVSKNKDGSYTLEANGKKVKSDDPSFFKDKLTPRVKKALAKEVGIDTSTTSKKSSTISLKSPSKVFKKIPAKNSDELYKKTLSYLGGRISANTNNGLIEGTIQNSTKKDDRVVLTIKKDDGSLTKISTSILGASKYQAPQPDASKIKEIKDSKKGVGVKISSAVGATDWSTVNYLINSGMEIQYQHGLSFRRGSNSFKKISAEEALEKMHQNATFDAGVKDGILYINTYSGFDMD